MTFVCVQFIGSRPIVVPLTSTDKTSGNLVVPISTGSKDKNSGPLVVPLPGNIHTSKHSHILPVDLTKDKGTLNL